MAELFLFTAFCLILGIGAGIQDFIERKRNARARRIKHNVQSRSGSRIARSRKRQYDSLFSEQESVRKGYQIRRYA